YVRETAKSMKAMDMAVAQEDLGVTSRYNASTPVLSQATQGVYGAEILPELCPMPSDRSQPNDSECTSRKMQGAANTDG
ncbi:MAG: hypothetical protein WCA20_27185, partial [Candidatus Sulfotelmatobacter sp.]